MTLRATLTEHMSSAVGGVSGQGRKWEARGPPDLV